MPVNVNDLKKHLSDSPLDIEKARASTAIAARNLLAAMLPTQQSLFPLDLVSTNHIAAEAEARRVNRDIRDLTRTGNEELQCLREEAQKLRSEAEAQAKKADASARKERLWQVFLVLVSWLLGLLSAPVLSHLLHI